MGNGVSHGEWGWRGEEAGEAREIESGSIRAAVREKRRRRRCTVAALRVTRVFHLGAERSGAEVDQTLAARFSPRRQREMPRRQKQSSEAIMSFRMQNSSFRLAALGTFTFKCKLAECAPQSRLAVSSSLARGRKGR